MDNALFTVGFLLIVFVVGAGVIAGFFALQAYLKQKLSSAQYDQLERLAEGIVRAVHQTAKSLGWDNATKKEVALLKLQEVAQKYNIKLSPGFADTLIEAAVSLVKEQLKWAGLSEEKKVDEE